MTCDNFAASVEGFMSNDAEVNRNDLDLGKFCQSYWEDTVTKAASAEVKRLEAEDATRAKAEEEKKKREEEEQKAKKAAEAKAAEASAVAKEEQDLAEAQSLAETASNDEVKISADVKEMQAQINLKQSSVDDMVDKARKALQIAAEKEAQAAEPKAPESAPVTPAADEVAAVKAGDSEADRIAEKALANAQKAVENAERHIANDKEPKVSNDTAAAVAEGDKLADKIAAKAAMIATKSSNKTASAIKVDAPKEVFKVFFHVKSTTKNGTAKATPAQARDQEVDIAFNEKPLVKEILESAAAKNSADAKVAKKA